MKPDAPPSEAIVEIAHHHSPTLAIKVATVPALEPKTLR